jgi:hypothetical protein
MSEKLSRKEGSIKISRREFLKDAGIIAGSAALGATALSNACAPQTTTTTVTGPTKTVTTTVENIKTVSVLPSAQKFTVLTPTGTTPVVKQKPLTPRPVNKLEDYNKVYLVDITFSGSYDLTKAMADWFRDNRPNVKLEVTTEVGSYNVADEDVTWKRIKDNSPSCAIVVGGH